MTLTTAPDPVRSLRQHTDDLPDTDDDFALLVRLEDGPRRDRLRQQIVCAWLPVAERLARRFRDKGESFEDLTQVAALALVKAVDRFDPGLGHAFVSYAVPTITGELKRYFRDHMWTLHVPRSIQQARARALAARDALEQDGGSSPTVARIAELSGLSEEEVVLGLEAGASCEPLSLDAPSSVTVDRELAETMGEPDAGIELVVDREALKPLLAKLPERERRILYLRFFRDLTQNEIGRMVGISQMHVSRTITRTCDRLRQGMLRAA
jgi:RNA polymerase sigma-B factor